MSTLAREALNRVLSNLSIMRYKMIIDTIKLKVVINDTYEAARRKNCSEQALHHIENRIIESIKKIEEVEFLAQDFAESLKESETKNGNRLI